MIEIPRAALTADQLAKYAQFFLRHQRLDPDHLRDLARDDAEKGFLVEYLNRRILPENPFASIDEEGVGKLMRMAVELGRGQRPGMEIGICGEHGGDPKSIAFCHRIGLNYVSCSPFRIPIARLAAAHAAPDGVPPGEREPLRGAAGRRRDGGCGAVAGEPARRAIVAVRPRGRSTSSRALLTGRAVVVEGDRIREVAPAERRFAGASVIELGDVTVLPGLIDCHTHVTTTYSTARRRPMQDGHRFACARATLEAGHHGARRLAQAFIDVALRDAIERGEVDGPRMGGDAGAGSTGGHDEDVSAWRRTSS
jgi:hypothetical protein